MADGVIDLCDDDATAYSQSFRSRAEVTRVVSHDALQKTVLDAVVELMFDGPKACAGLQADSSLAAAVVATLQRYVSREDAVGAQMRGSLVNNGGVAALVQLLAQTQGESTTPLKPARCVGALSAGVSPT
jgi:hypothetical protein